MKGTNEEFLHHPWKWMQKYATEKREERQKHKPVGAQKAMYVIHIYRHHFLNSKNRASS